MIVEWESTEHRFENGSMLLGNGASRSVWEGFGYASLFERAGSIETGLGEDAVAVFDEFETHDFESVLRSVQTTKKVLDALEQDSEQVATLHEAIREALIQAVHSVHVGWAQFQAVAEAYRAALASFDWLFSTNYDLLVYWSIMHDGIGDGFKDAFWGQGGLFDRDDAEFWDEVVKVVYLHGGLHIERDSFGRSKKRDTALGNLLEKFGPDLDAGTTPLFISEGSADHKARAILRSEYLSWALDCLEDLDGPLIIFGSALSDADDHIVRAINRSSCNPIGVSVHLPAADDPVATEKGIAARFPHKKVIAFDAASHPLGNTNLRIEP